MLERGEGRLVNMLSEAAFTTPPAPAGAGGWGVAYAAAKAAFHRVTDMCHVEFAGQGIWAFSIAPGLTLTESMRASGMDKVLVGAGHVPAPRRWRARWPPGWATTPRPCATPARWCRRASCARSSRSCQAQASDISVHVSPKIERLVAAVSCQ
jgi:NAD(P)-dependent dehydrogenase (short-subunit alcohol dehydrogenase family)